jgi:hypothetical protein
MSEHTWKYVDIIIGCSVCEQCGAVRLVNHFRYDTLKSPDDALKSPEYYYYSSMDDFLCFPARIRFDANREPNCDEVIIESVLR